MLWIVDTDRGSAIVAARSASAATGAVWQASSAKFASDDEIRAHSAVIIVADAVSDDEARRLRHLLG